MGLSMSHLVLVLVVVLVIFGAGRLPKMMGDLAKGIRAFRDGMKEGGKETEDTPALPHHTSSPRASSDSNSPSSGADK